MTNKIRQKTQKMVFILIDVSLSHKKRQYNDSDVVDIIKTRLAYFNKVI